jgi:hypothetical protein
MTLSRDPAAEYSTGIITSAFSLILPKLVFIAGGASSDNPRD